VRKSNVGHQKNESRSRKRLDVNGVRHIVLDFAANTFTKTGVLRHVNPSTLAASSPRAEHRCPLGQQEKPISRLFEWAEPGIARTREVLVAVSPLALA
jgi:hypothetical protein